MRRIVLAIQAAWWAVTLYQSDHWVYHWTRIMQEGALAARHGGGR